MAWLLLVLVASAVGAWHVACAIGLRRTVDVATTCTLVLCAQGMGLALLVGGAARQLHPLPMLLAALALAAAEVWLTRRGDADSTRRRTAAMARAGMRGAFASIGRRPVVVALGVLVVAQYAWRAALGSFLPASDWDGLVYHLTGPDVWIQQGHVGHTPQQIWADAYPQGQELLIAWIGTFTGSMQLAWASGLPFFLLGALSVAGLARTAGARREDAALVGLGFLAVPAVAVQASTTYVDVATSATILAALQVVLALPQAVRQGGPAPPVVRRHLLVAGLALAVATSIKSFNLLGAALVACVALVQVWRITRDASLLPSASLLLLAPAAILSSYWYLRTWSRYGSPFYPLAMLGFEGPLTFDANVREQMTPEIASAHGPLARILVSWSADAIRHAFRYDQRVGGFGPQWLYLLLPALGIGLALFARRRRWDLLCGLALPLAVLFVASPAPWWARYTLFVAAFGCVSFGALLGAARPPALATLAGAVFAGLCALGMWWATEPTHVVGLTRSGWAVLTARQAIEFMRDPVLRRRIDPVVAYQRLDRLPVGAVVAATWDGPQHVHLILGERRQRKLVSLGWSADIADLRRSVRESGAQYVLLGSAGHDAALHRAALVDRAHFRRLPRLAVGPFDLFEFGEFGAQAPP